MNKLKKGASKPLEKEDTILMMVEGGVKPHNDIWIVDLSASMHITNSKVGLYDIKNICEPVKIGDVKLVYATNVGWLRVSYRNQEGENAEFVLESIQYVPGFWIKLFCLVVAMSKGCSINNKGYSTNVQ